MLLSELKLWFVANGFPPHDPAATAADATTPIAKASYPGDEAIVGALIRAGSLDMASTIACVKLLRRAMKRRAGAEPPSC